MKILMKGKVETVSVDRVKPAHFVCAPDTGTEVERKTQQKTTHSKTARVTHGTGKELKGSSSKITLKPVRQGAESHTTQRDSSRHVPLVRGRRSLLSPKRLEHTC